MCIHKDNTIAPFTSHTHTTHQVDSLFISLSFTTNKYFNYDQLPIWTLFHIASGIRMAIFFPYAFFVVRVY